VSLSFAVSTAVLATAEASPIVGATVHQSAIVLAAGKNKPGECGAYMYWGAKEHKCLDARTKSKEGPFWPF
jgi:hypothetical protein